MKRLFVITILFLFVLAGPALAAGTCTQAAVVSDALVRTVTFICTADSSDGSYPATAMDTASLSYVTGWQLLKVSANPGGTAPTPLTDFTLTDGDGIDVLDGNGIDLIDDVTSQSSYPQNDGVPVLQPVVDAWTLAITNNSVNSAIIVIKLIFTRK